MASARELGGACPPWVGAPQPPSPSRPSRSSAAGAPPLRVAPTQARRKREPIATNLDAEGQRWLAEHRDRNELFRLPAYSPELNGIEGVWKVTKKTTTHNRFYRTAPERDAALVCTFETFKAYRAMIAGHVARFL